jgi:urease accessory protein
MRGALLLLADGRFPAGGHAHSAGVEAAVLDGRVRDEASLEAYVLGRLHTVGLTEAALAAAALRLDDVSAVDAEADARIVVPALRAASRRLGRQLLRVGRRCWPAPLFDGLSDLHQPVALGVVGAAAGLGAHEVAELAVHHALTTPAQAGVRLLGLDPFAVAAMVARLGYEAAAVVELAVSAAVGPLEDLPGLTGVVCDIAAAAHAERTDRLFAT